MNPVRTVAVLSVLMTSLGSASDYLPLKEGNQWTYTMSNGMQVTTKITGFENVGVIRCAVVETTMGGQTSREYVAADTQGIKSYVSQAQGQEMRYDPPVLRVKLPYQEGDTWQATVNQVGMSITTSFQSVGRERIETPAGMFDCIKVRSSMTMGQGQTVVGTIWYADGVGPVHQTMEVGGQEITIKLISTNVQPAPEAQATSVPPVQSPAELRCPKCGAKIQPGTKFCAECGTKLEPPRPVTPANCPKCGAKLPSGAKFCPACGERITASAATSELNQPARVLGNQPALEKYQSADGKVLLYRPQGWNVTQGEMFGAGTYGVVVMEPQENAVVIFITFPVN